MAMKITSNCEIYNDRKIINIKKENDRIKITLNNHDKQIIKERFFYAEIQKLLNEYDINNYNSLKKMLFAMNEKEVYKLFKRTLGFKK